MESFGHAEDPRRRILISGLAAGVFSAVIPGKEALADSLFGTQPSKLPPGQSIYRISGTCTVNGKEATLATFIGPNDTVATGKNSEVIFVVGGHAMILRSESNLTLQEDQRSVGSFLLSGLRLLSGKLLSVSRNKGMSIKTPTATIGIRGTGVYLEAEPDETYFCTCYGTTDIMSTDDPSSKTTVVATHHDRPQYITRGAQSGKNVRAAGYREHTDQELMLIETLVGRTTPFVFAGKNNGHLYLGY